MFGFVFGTACLVGLAVVVARGRRRRWGGPFGRGPLYGAFARLGTNPGQEKVIVAAIDELRETARRARATAQRSREAAARSVRGDVFDEAALRESFLEQDATIAELREAFLSAARKIHETLDERQRKSLGDLVEAGPGLGHCGYGPRFGGHHHHHHHAYC